MEGQIHFNTVFFVELEVVFTQSKNISLFQHPLLHELSFFENTKAASFFSETAFVRLFIGLLEVIGQCLIDALRYQ